MWKAFGKKKEKKMFRGITILFEKKICRDLKKKIQIFARLLRLSIQFVHSKFMNLKFLFKNIT